ncbi:MAG: DUF4012 domain-containing protein [Ilumatobacteraceae bacterium]
MDGGRALDLPVAAVAIVAGVVATFAPPAPTGNTTIDAAFVGLGVGLIVLVGALAPWWAVAIAAGAALAIAVDPLLMLVAALALGLALWLGATRRTTPVLSALALGATFNVMARAELGGFLGLSALVAAAIAFLVFVTAIGRHTRLVRRLSLAGIGLAVAFVGVASVGFAYEAARSRHELAGGLTWAELGVSQLENDEFDVAATSFENAAASLAAAHERVSAPLAAGAAFVPVLAQHRSAVVDMSGVGATGATTVAEALDEIDLDALRTVDGRINLDALAALEEPLTRVRTALVSLQETTNDARSPWLVGRATYELDDFDESVAEHLPSLDNALDAIRMAPTMLGADGPRTYLVVFTTPSESRGLGGMIGNYAELTVDDGLMSLSGFGRGEDIDAAASSAGVRLDGPDGFLEQYGRFGFDSDGAGLVGNSAMRNAGMSPNFPWVGEVASDVYTQTTGRSVDGVIAMDPYVVAALLRYTGPVRLVTLDQELNADNAVPFLLRDQYVLAEDKAERVDALAEAASITFEALLGDALPEPITIARDLGPLAAERRLLVWSADPEEQALLERVHLAGQIPPPDGADGWSFTVTNGGGNKIDSFLERAAGYTSTTDPATGETTATLHVRLTNTAPAEGFPPYVIGNRVGLPSGTNRLYVSFYSPLPLTGVTLDGQPIGLAVGQEQGWNVYSGFVDIPPGDGTADFELQLAGVLEHPDAEIVTWEQPMGSPVQPL